MQHSQPFLSPETERGGSLCLLCNQAIARKDKLQANGEAGWQRLKDITLSRSAISKYGLVVAESFLKVVQTKMKKLRILLSRIVCALAKNMYTKRSVVLFVTRKDLPMRINIMKGEKMLNNNKLPEVSYT